MAISQAASHPFRTRVRAFIREVYPEPILRRAVGGYFVSDPRPSRAEAASEHGYIRKLRAGSVDQPGLSRAWDVGFALSRLTQKRWVNPPVMLFVCGYYGHVAALLIQNQYISRDRKLLMAEALRTVAIDIPRESVAEMRQQLVLEGFDELTAHTAAEWDAEMPGEPRNDRGRWALTGKEFASFLAAWKDIERNGLDMNNPAIATCQFITEHAEYDVEEREKIVIRLIANALPRAQ